MSRPREKQRPDAGAQAVLDFAPQIDRGETLAQAGPMSTPCDKGQGDEPGDQLATVRKDATRALLPVLGTWVRGLVRRVNFKTVEACAELLATALRSGSGAADDTSIERQSSEVSWNYVVKKASTTQSTAKRRATKAAKGATRSRAGKTKARGPKAAKATRAATRKKRSLTPSTRNRDDFPMPVLRLISNQVSLHCSNPTCWTPTVGPSMQKGISNVGVGAHITAAAKGGPRYNPKLTAAQRRSASNAIWLCNNCGRLVDNDTSTYTVPQLRQWKRDAIDRAQKELASGGRSTTEELAAAQLAVQQEALAHQKQTHEAQRLTRFGDLYSRFLEEAKAYADAIEEYWKQMYLAGYQPDRPTRAAMQKPIDAAFAAMKRALQPIILADSDQTRQKLRWELIRLRRFEPTHDTIATQKMFAEWIHYHLLRLREGITRLQDNVREALGHQPQQRSEADLAFVEKMLADSRAKAEAADADIQSQFEKNMREHKTDSDPAMPAGNEVRNRIWNVLHAMIFEDDEEDDVPTRRGSLTLSFLREIWSEVLSRPIDEVPTDFVTAWKVFRQVVMTCPDGVFYAIVQYAGGEKDIRAKLEEALQRSGAPYRFDGDKVLPTPGDHEQI